MSFLAMHGPAMRRRRYGQSDDDPVWLVVVTMTLAFFVLAIVAYAVAASVQWAAEQDQANQQWLAGSGRPQAVLIAQGETAVVPGTVDAIGRHWYHCSDRTCHSDSFLRYPNVYPVGAIQTSFVDGCYTGHSTRKVGSIMAASTRGGQYRVTLGTDGATITICRVADAQESDAVVIWSDDPNAWQG